MIKVLYGNAISFTPDDVNINVIQIVDTMLDQITKCHQRIKPIALIFEALAIYIHSKYPHRDINASWNILAVGLDRLGAGIPSL